MPEQKATLVYYEGDDDRSFLRGLLDAGLLPSLWQLAIRDKSQHPGKDGLIRQMLPFVSPVNGVDGRAVVLVDLDEFTRPQLADWFRTALARDLTEEKYAGVSLVVGQTTDRVFSYRLIAGDRIGLVVLVPVGHPEDAEINARYHIDRFDDWVLRLALDQRVFENVSDLRGITHSIAVKKFSEVGQLFRANGLEVRKAKAYIQILRALAAIRPSTAVIVERLVKNGFEVLGKDAFATLIRPFLDDIATAVAILDADTSPRPNSQVSSEGSATS